MKFLVMYYVIGNIVSLFSIYHYRYRKGYNRPAKKSDGWAALLGVWFWPLQIISWFQDRYGRL